MTKYTKKVWEKDVNNISDSISEQDISLDFSESLNTTPNQDPSIAEPLRQSDLLAKFRYQTFCILYHVI